MDNLNSPGVHDLGVRDLTTYATNVPTNMQFIAFVSEKGEDNQLKVITSPSQLEYEYGKANLMKFENFYQGLMNQKNYVSNGGSLYAMRVLPEDASYQNSFIDLTSPHDDVSKGFTKFVNVENEYTTDLVSTNLGLPTSVKVKVCSTDQGKKLVAFEDGTIVFVDDSETLDEDALKQLYKGNTIKLSTNQYDTFVDSFVFTYDSTDYTLSSVTESTLTSLYIPLFMISSKSRGDFYNKYYVSFHELEDDDMLQMDILEEDGMNISTVESYTVSFVVGKKDKTGNSVYINDVISKYSNAIKYIPNNAISTDAVLNEIKTKLFDTSVVTVHAINKLARKGSDIALDVPATYITDDLVDIASIKEFLTTNSVVIPTDLQDSNGNIVNDLVGIKIEVAVDPSLDIQVSRINTPYKVIEFVDDDLNPTGTVSSYVKGYYTITSAGKLRKFDPYGFMATYVGLMNLKNGSDGSLFDSVTGKINSAVATSTLADAYNGILDADKDVEYAVLDKFGTYFLLVLDAGYPKTVKDQIVNLATSLREDCQAILDMGITTSVDDAVNSRKQLFNYNDFRVALYDNAGLITDPVLGIDTWVASSYAIEGILQKLASGNTVWSIPAGLKRGAISDFKILKYKIKTQDDIQKLTTLQVNPIVSFGGSYTYYGDYTALKDNKKLQELHASLLYLYIKRAIDTFAQFYVFDENTSETWDSVRKEVNLFLQDIQARGGLQSFEVNVGATELELSKRSFHIHYTLDIVDVSDKIFVSSTIVG